MSSLEDPEETPRWRDVKDTAAICGVTTGTVYRWIKDRKVIVTCSGHYRLSKYLVDLNTVPTRRR